MWNKDIVLHVRLGLHMLNVGLGEKNFMVVSLRSFNKSYQSITSHNYNQEYVTGLLGKLFL